MPLRAAAAPWPPSNVFGVVTVHLVIDDEASQRRRELIERIDVVLANDVRGLSQQHGRIENRV
jgi:hypothetical protein